MPNASLFHCLPLHPFPRALAPVLLCQVQETGREGLGTRREPEVIWKCQPHPPCLQSPLHSAASSLTPNQPCPILTPAPFAHVPILLSLPPQSKTSLLHSLPLFPLCFSLSWALEWCGEPRDRTGFILGKNIHGRGYHSNKFPWCLHGHKVNML